MECGGKRQRHTALDQRGNAGVLGWNLPVFDGCGLGDFDTVAPAKERSTSPEEAKAVSAFGFASLCHRTP
jgi:hypothetical protein